MFSSRSCRQRTRRAHSALFATLLLPIAAGCQERPWYVTSCQVMSNPSQYIETLVTVAGLVLVENGEMTMHGYDCYDDHGTLHLELGGQPVDPKDRFRVSRERLEAGTVPLKKDADYDRFARMLLQAKEAGTPKMFRATVTGRFFLSSPSGSSRKRESTQTAVAPKARLVIGEVDLASDELEEPVDFAPLSVGGDPPRSGCSSIVLPLPSRDEEDKLQRDSLKEQFAYLHDPKKVAERTIAVAASADAEVVERGLRQMGFSEALATFAWTSPENHDSYVATMNKPYWLLQTAVSGDAVIWAPKQVVRVRCAGAPHISR